MREKRLLQMAWLLSEGINASSACFNCTFSLTVTVFASFILCHHSGGRDSFWDDFNVIMIPFCGLFPWSWRISRSFAEWYCLSSSLNTSTRIASASGLANVASIFVFWPVSGNTPTTRIDWCAVVHSKFSDVVRPIMVHSLVVKWVVFSNVSKTDDDGGKAYAITPGRSLALEYWLGWPVLWSINSSFCFGIIFCVGIVCVRIMNNLSSETLLLRVSWTLTLQWPLWVVAGIATSVALMPSPTSFFCFLLWNEHGNKWDVLSWNIS